ncbi:MAG: NADH-quinone oxidoreductase subunit C [Ignavibacterium album]|uniref:NADH-quinone oxidoreductase subunit C n=1 Tax=Ignavibacterium album TaxID=591197 RepID=UPI0026EEC3A8|nr:NADH-quinone oxidoreductase subunit C [Ignavibacterium album]MBI5660942.1 NADH-quinone oxidoreductase subunit C [Ignavibacterium album]
MKNTEEIFLILKNNFPDSELTLKTDIPAEPFIIVSPFDVDKISLFLRDNSELQFDSLMCLSGVDDFNGQKIKDEAGNEIMQGGTLSVYYHLESTSLRHKVVLKTSTSRDNPEVVSVSEIWQAANWHEREAYDMFGIKFINHPDLRRILMPYDWEFGYPLRKDYQNPEFYQGMKVPY